MSQKPKHIHILGICGTFMAGIALLAKEAGFRVTGSDAAAWPPMSTQLREQGIEVISGYSPDNLNPAPDLVVVGNVISRGNVEIEAVLNRGLKYVSGPQWLGDNILAGKHVLAVAGTHGKTTTSSMLAWLLESAGLNPGFLIGGVPLNFGVSARIGGGQYFVVEADEYDTAFFDKRSKFVHYRPNTAVLNNLEFDHADIFPDLAAIERQFHHLIRTIPGEGCVVVNGADENLNRVLEKGCWSRTAEFDSAHSWNAQPDETGQGFSVYNGTEKKAHAGFKIAGTHNRSNALAAIVAAHNVGVSIEQSGLALGEFENVRRRMELRGTENGVDVIDDFAHHPTAIDLTIKAARERKNGKVIAVLEPRSNTMRLGIHQGALVAALDAADHCIVLAREDLNWDAADALKGLDNKLALKTSVDDCVAAAVKLAESGDQILVMSNGDFGGIHQKLLDALRTA